MRSGSVNCLKILVLAGALALAQSAAGQSEPWAASYRLESLGQYAEAQAEVGKVLAAQPGHEFALIRSAWLAYLQGRYAESEGLYLKAAQRNARMVEASQGLMLPLMAQYRWVAAIEAGRKVLAENAWDYTAHVRIMACEEAMSRWEDLARHAAQVSERYPADATILVYWARAESALRNTRKARQLYDQVLERFPKHAEAARAFEPAPQRSVDGPGVRIGDTWMYNKIDGVKGALEYVSVNAVDKIERDAIAMTSSSLDGKSVSKVFRNAGFNQVRTEAPGSSSSASPFYPSYSFPLQVGKTWRRTVDLTNSAKSDTTVRAELESRVVGWEVVTVPAGTFLALRIETKGAYRGWNFDGNWFGRIEDTLWYSPATRNAVRYEYKDTVGTTRYNHEIHELVRFWPGK